MPMNYFEKLDNVYIGQKSGELKPAMTVNGNLSSLLRGSTRIFENQGNEAMINEPSQRQLKL